MNQPAEPMHDDTLPEGRWAFDAEVTARFPDMLRRSIPGYDAMRRLTLDLAADNLTDGPVLDLGASRGDAVAEIVEQGRGNEIHLVEVSPPMLEVLRSRFGDRPEVHVHDLDLRTDFPDVSQACIALSVLTLQFVPIEHRQRVVSRAYQALAPGGVLLLVEKVLGCTAAMHESLGDLYHRTKAANGYTPDQIHRKALALEGVLVPVTAAWNVQLLQSAGFRDVECYWRHLCFAAWIARK